MSEQNESIDTEAVKAKLSEATEEFKKKVVPEAKKLTKFDIAKIVVRFAVGRAVGHTVGMIIEKNVEPETKIQKAEIYVGSHVIGSLVADSAKDRVSGSMDKWARSWNNAKAQNEKDNTSA